MVSQKARIPKLGSRSTRQRTAVIDTIIDLDNFASAKEIHRELERRDAKVGLTTVYRTLQSLADVDAVDVLRMGNGETLYRHCMTDQHHHHLVCVDCGTTLEIKGGPVETWAEEVAKEHGYTLTGHDAEIYGRCSACQKAKAEERANDGGEAGAGEASA